jgi:uncharacterized protein with HEPN domain
MSEKDKGNILAIKEAIDKILSFTKDIQNANEFYDDIKTFDAVLMNFVVIGESVVRLSDDFKSNHNYVEWQKIKDFRNIVAHDYFGIDPEDVW